MSCLRFLNSNFLDTFATATVSSQQTDYPDDNIYDSYRRKKVWRSNGYWDLSGGTASIVFQETIGVDLTATLAASEYITDALFIAAIKTALDAAGDSTYTVSRDTTTNKIKIVSNGSGGGGIFRPQFQTSTFMAGVMGFDTVALTGALTYTADELRIHTSEWFEWDLGIASNPNAFALIGPRNTPLVFSPGATLKLQGNETNDWSAPSYDQTITYDNYVLWLHSSTGLHTGALRYWRFYIVDYANPLGYVEAGVVYLGDSYEFERGSPQFGFTADFIDRSDTIFSEGGQEFTQQREQSDKFSFTVGALTSDDVEDFDDIFNNFGLHKPMFVSMDTPAGFSSAANRWVRLCKFEKPPGRTLESYNFWKMQLELRETL